MKPKFNVPKDAHIILIESVDLKERIISITNRNLRTNACERMYEQHRFRIMRDGYVLDYAESADDLNIHHDEYDMLFIEDEDLMVISNDRVQVGDFISLNGALYLALSEDCERLFDIEFGRECTKGEIGRIAKNFAECEISRL